MSPLGPGQDEFMTPALIEYVWEYMKHGDLDVTPTLDAADAERALEYFGFSGLAVTVPDSDPRALGKQVAYKVHCDSMKAASPILQWIKKTMLVGNVGIAGVHLIVDDHRNNPRTNQYGVSEDALLGMYSVSPPGTLVLRLGDYAGETSYEGVFRLLSGDDKTAKALREKIQRDVTALGGLNVAWERKSTPVKDVGEYGSRDFERDYRHVLKITLDTAAEPEEGIKRRKVA